MNEDKVARLEEIFKNNDWAAANYANGDVQWMANELREAWTQQEKAEGASSAKGAALKASLEFGSKLREELADYREALKKISDEWCGADEDPDGNIFATDEPQRIAREILEKWDRTKKEASLAEDLLDYITGVR